MTKSLPRGTSTWIYKYTDGVVRQVKRFNEVAPPDLRFRYFFPYAGSVSFNAADRQLAIRYNSTAIQSYAQGLSRDILLMPMVDGRADDKEFNGWTEEQYREAARQVAQYIIDDPHATGIHIDIEPFTPAHLPFYRQLREFLNVKGKYATMFVGPWDTDTLKQIFASCDIVVISGYDVAGEGATLPAYQHAMREGLARVQQAAVATGGHYLVGIPASASWGEYEYIAGGGSERKESGVKQEQYLQAALDAVRPYRSCPQYLGLSLWRMTDPETEHEQPEEARAGTKFPNVIRPSVWKLLEQYR